MKSLYITSVERYSGKTATCLALGKKLQSDGYKVGYLKPFSLQPWRVSGHVADEDAAFVIEALGLEAQPWELSPVVVTSEALRQRLHQPQPLGVVAQAGPLRALDGLPQAVHDTRTRGGHAGGARPRW